MGALDGVRVVDFGQYVAGRCSACCSPMPARPWSPEHRAPPQASDEVWAHEMRPNLIRTSDDGTDRLPLEGVRVLDLTQVLAGPTAGPAARSRECPLWARPRQ
jgi:hypothetical protein